MVAASQPSWIDVAAFDAAQAAADAPGVTAPHELEALRTAIDLYRGDLLEGCYDEWVLDVRERFRERYLSHLLRLAEVLAADGDYAEATRVGRELLRNDPLREETSRFLMRVHVAAGDRAAAVRVYYECVSTLQRELGVEPSAETIAAYAAITRSEPSGPAEPNRIAETTLVGRDDEWQQLIEHWRDAEKGDAHLVLVSGEPGVGKTRLVEELAAWCAHRARSSRRRARIRLKGTSASAPRSRGCVPPTWPANFDRPHRETLRFSVVCCRSSTVPRIPRAPRISTRARIGAACSKPSPSHSSLATDRCCWSPTMCSGATNRACS